GVSGIKDIPTGLTGSATYFANRYAGFTFDGGGHFGPNSTIGTMAIGPTFRLPSENITPFAHAFVGLHHMDTLQFGADGGVGIIAGGGMDLRALKKVSIRLFQADYEWAHHNFLPFRPNLQGARLSAGLVFHFGTLGPPPAPPSAACTVQPTEVFAGEPVTATATGSNFNPKKTTTYAWSGTGV